MAGDRTGLVAAWAVALTIGWSMAPVTGPRAIAQGRPAEIDVAHGASAYDHPDQCPRRP